MSLGVQSVILDTDLAADTQQWLLMGPWYKKSDGITPIASAAPPDGVPDPSAMQIIINRPNLTQVSINPPNTTYNAVTTAVNTMVYMGNFGWKFRLNETADAHILGLHRMLITHTSLIATPMAYEVITKKQYDARFGTALPEANMTQIDGEALPAQILRQLTKASIIDTIADSPAPTTTTFTLRNLAASSPSVSSGELIGRRLLFLRGSSREFFATRVAGFTAPGAITVAPACLVAPVGGAGATGDGVAII